MSSTYTANLDQVDVMPVKAFVDRVGRRLPAADRPLHQH